MFVAIERRSMATAVFVLMGDEHNKDGGRHVTPFDISESKAYFILIDTIFVPFCKNPISIWSF